MLGKFVVGALLSSVIAVTTAQAKEIHVLYSSPVGGLIDGQNKAMQESLEKKGYRVEVVRAPNCRAAKAWLDANPTKPVVFNFQVEEEAYARLNPNAADACGIEITRKNLLAVGIANHYLVCSMMPKEQAMQKFLAGGNRVGVTYFAATNVVVAESLIRAMNLKDTKALRFQGQPKLTQALVSGDVNFTVNTNAGSIVNAGGQCFLSTAPADLARQNGWRSVAEFDAKNPWINGGQMYVYLTYNTDHSAMTAEAVDVIKNHSILNDARKHNAFITGVAAGQTADQQFKMTQQHIDRYLAK